MRRRRDEEGEEDRLTPGPPQLISVDAVNEL
jgi:hypothetical protein